MRQPRAAVYAGDMCIRPHTTLRVSSDDTWRSPRRCTSVLGPLTAAPHATAVLLLGNYEEFEQRCLQRISYVHPPAPCACAASTPTAYKEVRNKSCWKQTFP